MSNYEAPHDLNAEAAVLSACMHDKKAVVRTISANLTEIDFYRRSHKNLFSAIMELYRNNDKIDIITITAKMKKAKTFEKSGGLEFINKISGFMLNSENLDSHLEIVKETSRLRRLYMMSEKIKDNVINGKSSAELLYHYNSETAKIMSTGRDDTVSIGEVNDILEQKYDDGDELLVSFPTYLQNIDYHVTMSAGNLVIIASRPSMGKSSLARQLAFNWATFGRARVLVFTLEMDSEEFTIATQAMAAEIPSQKIYNRSLNSYEEPRFTSLGDTLRSAKIQINDAGRVTPEMVRTILDKYEADEHKQDILLIDYLQLMSTSVKYNSRQQEISEISRQLKVIAKEKKLLVVALSQLNRQLESRENKRPGLSDLRESGAIEQDADVVMFIYREFVYDDKANENDAEIIIRKNRHGGLGTASMIFYPEIMRFSDKKYYRED
jgi:replicative DNA helicase